MGILLAPSEVWEDFESRWRERTGGLPFHANDCDSDRADFAPKPGEDEDKKHKENKNLYKDLTILLANSGVLGFASNVDLKSQAKYLPHLAIKPPDTYYRCFLDVVEAVQKVVGVMNEIAECTFDSRAESEFNAGFLYGQLRECYPQWAPRLAERITFDSSKKNPRIQAADLWTREAMKALDNEIGPKPRTRKSWITLKETEHFIAYSYSEKWFQDFSADFPDLKQRLGFDAQELGQWMKEKRVQPNFANMIRFLRPIMKKQSQEIE